MPETRSRNYKTLRLDDAERYQKLGFQASQKDSFEGIEIEIHCTVSLLKMKSTVVS